MGKEELRTISGTVTTKLPNGMYRVSIGIADMNEKAVPDIYFLA